MTPIIIKNMLIIVRLDMVSLTKKQANNGTNIYASDSKIGKSFSFTPLLIAVILISSAPPKIA